MGVWVSDPVTPDHQDDRHAGRVRETTASMMFAGKILPLLPRESGVDDPVQHQCQKVSNPPLITISRSKFVAGSELCDWGAGAHAALTWTSTWQPTALTWGGS